MASGGVAFVERQSLRRTNLCAVLRQVMVENRAFREPENPPLCTP